MNFPHTLAPIRGGSPENPPSPKRVRTNAPQARDSSDTKIYTNVYESAASQVAASPARGSAPAPARGSAPTPARGSAPTPVPASEAAAPGARQQQHERVRLKNRRSQQRYREKAKDRQKFLESENAGLKLQMVGLQAALTLAHKDINALRAAAPGPQGLEMENAALKTLLGAEKAQSAQLCDEVVRLKRATRLYRSAVQKLFGEIATLRDEASQDRSSENSRQYSSQSDTATE